MYVCVCAYTSMSICVFVSMRVCVLMCVYVCVSICVCINVCVCLFTSLKGKCHISCSHCLQLYSENNLKIQLQALVKIFNSAHNIGIYLASQ